MKRIAIFASGSGTNAVAIYEAIVRGELDAQICLVVCDHADAPVIDKMRSRGIEVLVVLPKTFADKAAYETAILRELQKKQVEWLVLAGYMRLVTAVLLEPYANRIVNIHPSLLPDFAGKHAIERSYEAHTGKMGITIHYVDAGMDTGTIIAQEAFEVSDEMTLEQAEARIHAIEHRLYAQTLQTLWEETV